ncbi:uncharacterized protein LOC119638335 [Glossina fuscipes]|uniref:Uncharacterized protein LOC119638335 n=1 Tax=Glossina fuscipes TaxID=7396 RepID=A0A9C6DTN8_9MUSC|nr:uncharacterized protein LOC119638335 [Glossina fuscipes]
MNGTCRERVDHNPVGHFIPYELFGRCQILESNLSSVSLPGGALTSRAIEPKRVQRTAKSFVSIKNCCSFCRKPGHVIYRCSDFLSLSAADRLNKVHALKLCVNCLKFKKHNLSDCTSKGRCRTCGKGHHSLLHFQRPQVANYTASKHNQINETNHIESAENANYNMSDQAQPKNFAALKTQHTERNILATVIVYIISKYNQRLPCHVLLDGGSQINMIFQRMVHMIDLKRQYAPIPFQCANKTVGTSNFCMCNKARKAKKKETKKTKMVLPFTISSEHLPLIFSSS